MISRRMKKNDLPKKKKKKRKERRRKKKKEKKEEERKKERKRKKQKKKRSGIGIIYNIKYHGFFSTVITYSCLIIYNNDKCGLRTNCSY